MAEMTLGSLFDGIAGFPLAARRQGIKTVWVSEIEPDCIGYKFLDAEVKYNGYNAAFYIYARMVKAGAKGARQRK